MARACEASSKGRASSRFARGTAARNEGILTFPRAPGTRRAAPYCSLWRNGGLGRGTSARNATAATQHPRRVAAVASTG